MFLWAEYINFNDSQELYFIIFATWSRLQKLKTSGMIGLSLLLLRFGKYEPYW